MTDWESALCWTPSVEVPAGSSWCHTISEPPQRSHKAQEQLLARSMRNSNDVEGGLRLLQVIASELSRVMLIAIEVAVEYWLALTWSPQAQWLSEVSKSGVIQDEVIGSGHQPTPVCGRAVVSIYLPPFLYLF